MKSTGVVRQLDPLGRVVLPIELRRTLNINSGDSLEVFVDGEQIVLKKYQPGCLSCGGMNYKTATGGIRICQKCIDGAK